MEKKRQQMVIHLGENLEVDERKIIRETGYYTNLEEKPTPKADEEETEEP